MNKQIDTTNNLIAEIQKNSNSVEDENLKNLISKINPIKETDQLHSYSILATETRELAKYMAKLTQIKLFSEKEKITETQEMLQSVIDNKPWSDPYLEISLLLEWAVYRVFVTLQAQIPPDYEPIMNSDWTMPLSVAGGNRPDLVTEFDNFVVVVEDTVSSGARQYNTEGEPVTRHVADVQKSYNNKKPVYGLFIARDINPNVIEYYLVYHAFHKHPNSDQNLLIVPISIKDFLELYKKMIIDIDKGKKSFHEFFKNIEQSRNADNCNKCQISNLNVSEFDKLIKESIQKFKDSM